MKTHEKILLVIASIFIFGATFVCIDGMLGLFRENEIRNNIIFYISGFLIVFVFRWLEEDEEEMIK